MKRKARLIITRILRETTIQERASNAFCQICGHETEMLTAAESAAFLETDTRKLNELITHGKIHAIETVTGNLRICKKSLLAKGSVR